MHSGDEFEPETWLVSYEPSTADGRGDVVLTSRPEDAKTFPSQLAAWSLWRAQSKTVPTRPDGKPNRPFTAFTIEVEPVPAEESEDVPL